MSRSFWLFLNRKAAIFFVVLFLVSIQTMAKSEIAPAGQALDAAYTITFQNQVDNELLPEETVKVKSGIDGSIYMRWIGQRYRDRELLYRPDWNKGNAWIKEGGTLDFCAVSVGLDDPIIKMDYRRAITFFNLNSMRSELAKLTFGDTKKNVDQNEIVIRQANNDELQLTLDSDGLPKKIMIKNDHGDLLERYEISELKTGQLFNDATFEITNPEFDFPGYSKTGIFIHAENLKENLERSWDTVNDYTCTFYKEELINDTFQERRTVSLKFRKPLDLYMKWEKGPCEDREVLYRQGTDEKVLAHEGGLLGLVTVHLSLDSRILKRHTNHRLTDLDIGFTLNTIYTNLVAAMKAGDSRLKFRGVEVINGRRLYMVESWINSDRPNDYYAPHSIIGHDMETGLPLKVINFNNDDVMFERLIWTKITFNTGLTDADFDPDNPKYNF